jgi:hypothetical protein
MGRLQAEKSLIPKGIMEKANILDLEFFLTRFPLLRPSQMRFIQLLAQFGNFDLIWIRKNDPEHRPSTREIPAWLAILYPVASPGFQYLNRRISLPLEQRHARR